LAPAVLRARAGGLHRRQRHRRGALGLQARQQQLEPARLVGVAARHQRGQVSAQVLGLRVRRRRTEFGAQRFEVAASVEGPGELGIHRHAKGHRDAPRPPLGHRHGQRLLHFAHETAAFAHHAVGFQRGAPFQHLRQRGAAAAHHLEVGQGAVHQRRVDPAARPRAGGGLLQQHQAEAIELHRRVAGVVAVVGRRHHLRQQEGGAADAFELRAADVRRHALCMAGVGQVQRIAAARGSGCGGAGGMRDGHGGGRVGLPTLTPGLARPSPPARRGRR
jgi:hypothetical protein